MGLDIHLYEVDKTSEEFLVLYEEDTNKSKNSLFEKYSKYVVKDVEKVVDEKATFKKKGVSFEDYEWSMCSGDFIRYTNISDKSTVEFSWDECEWKEIPIKKLPVRSVAYQRKGMVGSFYTQFLAGCWYVSQETELDADDSKDFVSTQQDLDKTKEFCEDGYPLKCWVLEDNQFVEFNY